MLRNETQYADYVELIATYCREEVYKDPLSFEMAQDIIDGLRHREAEIEEEIRQIRENAAEARPRIAECQRIAQETETALKAVNVEGETLVQEALRLQEAGLGIESEKARLKELTAQREQLQGDLETIQAEWETAKETAALEDGVDNKWQEVEQVYQTMDTALEEENAFAYDDIAALTLDLDKNRDKQEPYEGDEKDWKDFERDTAFFARIQESDVDESQRLIEHFAQTKLTAEGSGGGRFLPNLRQIRKQTAKHLRPDIARVMDALGIDQNLRTRQLQQIAGSTAGTLIIGGAITGLMLSAGMLAAPSIALGITATAIGLTTYPYHHLTRDKRDENEASQLYNITAPAIRGFVGAVGIATLSPDPITTMVAGHVGLALGATGYLSQIPNRATSWGLKLAVVGATVASLFVNIDPYAHVSNTSPLSIERDAGGMSEPGTERRSPRVAPPTP